MWFLIKPPQSFLIEFQAFIWSDFHILINICIITKQMRDKTTRKAKKKTKQSKTKKGQSRKQRFAFPCKNPSVPHESQ